MKPRVYYNDNEEYVCNWLANLMLAGLIPEGDIDQRSIRDIKPDDLRGYDHCHFFAGIGGWAFALQLAGWPDDRQVWTGSCPCQPFSVAGKQKGFSDERHLWPVWFNLIEQRMPPTIFGEQVASAKLWLDGVYTDMEAEGYAVGSAVLPACSVDAPHRRDRIWFVADADNTRWPPQSEGRFSVERERFVDASQSSLADADRDDGFWWSGPLQVGRNCIAGQTAPGGEPSGTQWRIGPGVSLLAHGVPARVAKLRALGNAIVPQVAAQFVKAFLARRP